MPEPEQTLADVSYAPMPPEAAAELRHWLDYQSITEEVFREREAQNAQWGDVLPPIGLIVGQLKALSRDELIQFLAAGVKAVQDIDRAKAAASA